MALPTDNRIINDIVASTREHVRPVLVDQIYNSNPLFRMLYGKGKVVIDGGEEIRVPFIYDKMPGGWYAGLGSFGTTTKETSTDFRFFWKQVYTEVTLPNIDVAKNQGGHRVFDLVASKFTNAAMTIADMLGTELFNTGTDSNKIVGLRQAINTSGSYGEITRGTDLVGTAAKAGLVDTTGGAITLPMLNDFMGQVSAGGAQKPDLLITTQSLWDALWARVEPSRRLANSDRTAKVGVSAIDINDAMVVADSHTPSGYVFGVPTDYTEFYVMEGYDFYVRGPFQLHGQDGFTAQTVMYCALAIQAPRLAFNASGLTA